ncbi:UNVERIFIED_ORG: phage-related protein [Anoxybacillus amylolyticus]
MAEQVVQIAISGVDEVSGILNRVTRNAEKAFQSVESAIESMPDLDIQADMSPIIRLEGAIQELTQAIRSMPSPKVDTSQARGELKKLQDEAENTQKSLKDINFEPVLSGMATGAGISAIVGQALESVNTETKIRVSFDVPPESIQTVKEATNTVKAYGIDAESALEGVRRQFALNADASDAANRKIVEGAGAIAAAYSGIDFTELIQEVNEIGSELEMSDQQALELVNSLLRVGFPPEQLDIISEYGQQLQRAGFDAKEIQAIFAAGVETGTWNIDNLLDGLKEGRIRLAEFGQGVDDSTKALLQGTGISAKQLQAWGQAVAAGGDKGKQAMQQVAKALMGVKDETKRNALGVAIFGTMWEDQGDNIAETLLNMNKHLDDASKNQDLFNQTVQQMNADPMVQMQKAFNNLNTALAPVYRGVADVVSKVAEWISENPKLAATIAAIVTVIGIITGLFLTLAPIVSTIATAMGVLGVSFGAIATPVLIVIGVIGALIAIIILLWKNWDSVSKFLSNSWNAIKNVAQTVFSALGAFFVSVWEGIKSVSITVWNAIKSALSTAWNTIKTVASTVFEAIKTAISNIWNAIKNVTSTVWNAIKSALTATWNGIKSAVSAVFNAIQTVISTVWNAIRTVTTTVWNAIRSALTTAWNAIKSAVSSVFNAIRNVISTVWNAIRSVTSSVWNGVKSAISSVINGIRSGISSTFNSIRSIISSVWNGVKSATSSAWNSVVSSVRGAVNKVIDFINRMINSINSVRIPIPKIPDWVPGIGGRGGGSIGFNIPNIPRLATGGVVDRPTLAIVGDAGAGNPEIVAPQRMLRSIIREELQNSGKQGTERIEIVVPVVMDGREIMRVVTPYIDRELGQRRIGKMRANGIGGSVL